MRFQQGDEVFVTNLGRGRIVGWSNRGTVVRGHGVRVPGWQTVIVELDSGRRVNARLQDLRPIDLEEEPVNDAAPSLELVSTEAEPRPREELVLPWTGEAFDMTVLGGKGAALVAALDVREQVELLIEYVSGELWEEAERLGTQTLHLGDYDVVFSGGPVDDYDVDAIAADLQEAGCPADRVQDIYRKPRPQLNKTVANALAAANPAYAAVVEKHRTTRILPRRARVKR